MGEKGVFLAFLVVSTTSLLPWNLFMNAFDYLSFKLHNSSSSLESSTSNSSPFSLHSDLRDSFEGWMTLSNGVACLLGSIANALLTMQISNNVRVFTGHVLVTLGLVPTVVLTFLDTDHHETAFFIATLSLAAIASLGSSGLIGGGILGFAAQFPPRFMQATMIGQAVAGILSSALSIVCQALTTNALLNGRLYFLAATGWTVFSCLVHSFLIRSSFVRGFMRPEALSSSSDHADTSRLLANDVEEEEEEEGESEEGSHSTTSLQLRPPAPSHPFIEDLSLVVKATLPYIIAAFLCLFVTLSAYPALASRVVSASTSATWKNYFVVTGCFLLFNVGDAIGRMMAHNWRMSGSRVVGIALIRILWVPAIFACNLQPRAHTRVFFPSDSIYVMLILTFAVSNGFLLSVASITAARRADPRLRELTGSLFGLVAVLSCLVGSLVGVLFAAAL